MFLGDQVGIYNSVNYKTIINAFTNSFISGPIYKIKQNPLSALSTNPLQRGCHEGLAVNTIAMPLDQVNGFNMVMFFFRVGG